MLVLDALFDHIQQISSNVEIIGSLVQFAQFWQLMSELGSFAPQRRCPRHVRLSPDSDQTADVPDRQLRAKSGPRPSSMSRHSLSTGLKWEGHFRVGAEFVGARSLRKQLSIQRGSRDWQEAGGHAHRTVDEETGLILSP
jgi:hypothetical protein